jgi:glycosyltransferase involved in cell wall biosynthesis
MLKICLLSHQYYHRDTRLRRYAETLADAGALVDVLCPKSPEDATSAKRPGIRVFPIPLKRGYSDRRRYLLEYGLAFLLYSLWLLPLYLRNGYQIIQVHNMPDLLVYAALIPKLLGAKLILDIRDPMPELYMSRYKEDEADTMQRLLRLQERLSCQLADRVITANANFQENLIARGIPEVKITMLSNAPDGKIFDRSKYARKAGDENDTFTLFYAGTIAPRYGLDMAIRAMPLLVKEIPKIRLLIFGGKVAHAHELIVLAKELDVATQVEFGGAIPLEQVPQEMVRADVGIYTAVRTPHTDIATPCKVLEYAVMGLPIVAPRLRILEQIFGASAISFFEPGDAKDFARCILELYRNPGRRARLVQEADEAYVYTQSWETEQRTYFRLLNELLPEREQIDIESDDIERGLPHGLQS